MRCLLLISAIGAGADGGRGGGAVVTAGRGAAFHRRAAAPRRRSVPRTHRVPAGAVGRPLRLRPARTPRLPDRCGRRGRRARARSDPRTAGCSAPPRFTSDRTAASSSRMHPRARAGADLRGRRHAPGRIPPARPRRAADHPGRARADRHRLAAVHRPHDRHEPARAGRPVHRVQPRRACLPHARHVPAHRARSGPRRASCAQQRPAAGDSGRRLLLRLPGGRAALSEVRQRRATAVRAAHRRPRARSAVGGAADRLAPAARAHRPGAAHRAAHGAGGGRRPGRLPVDRPHGPVRLRLRPAREKRCAPCCSAAPGS